MEKMISLSRIFLYIITSSHFIPDCFLSVFLQKCLYLLIFQTSLLWSLSSTNKSKIKKSTVIIDNLPNLKDYKYSPPKTDKTDKTYNTGTKRRNLLLIIIMSENT